MTLWYLRVSQGQPLPLALSLVPKSKKARYRRSYLRMCAAGTRSQFLSFWPAA